MMPKQAKYLSYLLRLWETNAGGEPVWCTSLEKPHGGERVGFANLDELLAYLKTQVGNAAPPDAEAPQQLE